jgi:hypothetical protein
MSPREQFLVGHPYITRLIKGVFNSRPPKVVLLPEWDLPLVLKKFEISSFWTYETFASSWRIKVTPFFCTTTDSSPIHKAWRSLHLLKEVMAIRNAVFQVTYFKWACFIGRAINYYLKKNETLRNSDDNVENSLFLAANEPHRPVRTQIYNFHINMTKIKSGKGWLLRPISCVYDRLHWSTIKKCPRWA